MLGKKVILQLLASLDELEFNILSAERSLKGSGLPSWVFERLDSYKQIVNKQRIIAQKLQEDNSNDFEAMFSLLNKINALSTLIFNDSEDLIAALSSGENELPPRKDYIYC